MRLNPERSCFPFRSEPEKCLPWMHATMICLDTGQGENPLATYHVE